MHVSLTAYAVAGHGGPNAADYVRQHLFAKLLANPKFNSDINTALSEPLTKHLASQDTGLC